MRVAHFYRDYLMSGGIPRETHLLVQAMAKTAEHIFVYCYSQKRNDEGCTTSGNVTIRAFHVPRWLWGVNFFYIPKVLTSMLQNNNDKVDVVILTGAFIPENIAIARFLVRADIPYVISPGAAFNPFTFRAFKRYKKSLYECFFERNMINNAIGVRLYSEVQERHLNIRGYQNNGRFFVVSEGIDWEKINDEIGKAGWSSIHLADSTPKSSFIFGYLGRLDIYTKGLDLLLEAWSIYTKSGGTGVLRIVGPGSERQMRKLMRLSENLELSGIEILPAKYGVEKYEFLKGISVLVHPSRHEGVPRVIRETLAIGSPVIVTDNTNLYDIILECGAGFVTSVDPADIAAAMKRFSEIDTETRDQLKMGALAASRRLNWQAIAEQYLQELGKKIRD